MAQIARNLTGACDGLLQGKRFSIVDRDTKFPGEYEFSAMSGTTDRGHCVRTS